MRMIGVGYGFGEGFCEEKKHNWLIYFFQVKHNFAVKVKHVMAAIWIEECLECVCVCV